MAAWLRNGSHSLLEWECDWSSQTGAMQSGILQGSNWDMPGFRWWEEDRQEAFVSNSPKNAREIEERHSNGKGLLYADGASRANLVSGDAPHSMITMSTVRTKREGRVGEDYFAFFANPYNVTRTLILVSRRSLRRSGSRRNSDVKGSSRACTVAGSRTPSCARTRTSSSANWRSRPRSRTSTAGDR